MIENISIREIRPQDFPKVLEMIKDLAAFVGAPHGVKNSESQLLEDQELFNGLVAVNAEGEIIAIATYFYAYFSWIGKSLYLDDFIVSSKVRGMGIGQLMFDHIIELARENGCRRVRWEVTKENHGAQQFYLKNAAEIHDDILISQIEF